MRVATWAIAIQLLLLLGSVAAQPTANDILAQAEQAYAEGKMPDVVRLSSQLIAANAHDRAALWLRARAESALGKPEASVADCSAILGDLPSDLAARDLRGSELFKQGKIADSLVDWDAVVDLAPEHAARHWRRGIALYYARRFDEGAKQFEAYQDFDGNDVENVTWRFLCMAAANGPDSARKALLPVGADRRVPMHEIYEMFAGRATPEEVIAAAQAPALPPNFRRDAQFYAELYVGLYEEALGNADASRQHIARAADLKMEHYMGQVARVHQLLRDAQQKPAAGK